MQPWARPLSGEPSTGTPTGCRDSGTHALQNANLLTSEKLISHRPKGICD